MNAQVNGRTFSGLNNFFVYLSLYLCHHFFDAGRMYASVGDELVECQTANFASYRIKGRDNNGFWSVVHYDFYSGCSFESTDVASFASDNASFHFVVVNVENSYAVFDGRFRSNALNGLYDDALGFLGCSHLGIVHDLVDVALGVGLSLIFERNNQFLFSFFG